MLQKFIPVADQTLGEPKAAQHSSAAQVEAQPAQICFNLQVTRPTIHGTDTKGVRTLQTLFHLRAQISIEQSVGRCRRQFSCFSCQFLLLWPPSARTRPPRRSAFASRRRNNGASARVSWATEAATHERDRERERDRCFSRPGSG